MTEIPDDFVKALNLAGLADFLAGCTNAHRQQYLKWIREAKRAETRRVRIGEAVEMLMKKKKEEESKAKKRASALGRL